MKTTRETIIDVLYLATDVVCVTFVLAIVVAPMATTELIRRLIWRNK